MEIGREEGEEKSEEERRGALCGERQIQLCVNSSGSVLLQLVHCRHDSPEINLFSNFNGMFVSVAPAFAEQSER